MKTFTHWRRRTATVAAVCAASALALSACGGAATDAEAGTGTGTGRMTVYYTALTADYLPLWIAQEEGLFKKHGLKIKLAEVEDASGIPALLSGDMQIGATAPTSVLAANANGAGLSIIATTDPTIPFEMLATKDVKDISDLKGKKIGVSSVGSGSDFATRVGLKTAGLDPNDVSILPLGSKSNRVAALTSGQIQAGVDNPPTSLSLKSQGLHVLFDIATMNVKTPTIVYAAKASWLKSNSKDAQAFMDALVEAIEVEHDDQATSVAVLKKYFDSDDTAAMDAAWKYFEQTVPASPVSNVGDFKSLIEFGAEHTPALADLDVSESIDNSFVEKASEK